MERNAANSNLKQIASDRSNPVSGKNTMSAAMKEAYGYHNYIFDKIRPHLAGRICEIGCGWGIYTKMILESGFNVLAIDFDSECIDYCRSELNEEKLTTFHGDISDPATIKEISDFNPGSVLMMQTLEHIEQDRKLLNSLAQAATGGTSLVINVPAFPALYGPMDQEAGHFRRYTRTLLSRCVTESGWRIEKVFFINPIGGIGWWINNRLFRRWTGLNADHINAQITFFNRYVLPVSKVFEVLTKNLFGQSLFLIAKLPERR